MDCPSQAPSGDGGRLADAYRSLARDHRLVDRTFPAGAIECVTIGSARAAFVQSPDIGVEGRKAFLPPRVGPVGYAPSGLVARGVGMIAVDEARQCDPHEQTVEGLAGDRFACACHGYMKCDKIGESLVGVGGQGVGLVGIMVG